MPETTKDATILIATSWQALGRAKNYNKKTILCNCIVAIVFAAFYIEANLNHIIEKLAKTEDMINFCGNKYPGLQDKLTWFYSFFIDSSLSNCKKQIYKCLPEKFPGFNKIHDFRNEISHGHIDLSLANITETEKLRNQAKSIVDQIFGIVKEAGYDIKRQTIYEVSIADID